MEPKYPVTVPDAEYYRQMVKCQAACPVLTDARGYIQALARGEYAVSYTHLTLPTNREV